MSKLTLKQAIEPKSNTLASLEAERDRYKKLFLSANKKLLEALDEIDRLKKLIEAKEVRHG